MFLDLNRNRIKYVQEAPHCAVVKVLRYKVVGSRFNEVNDFYQFT
jgi:hypothetical protein